MGKSEQKYAFGKCGGSERQFLKCKAEPKLERQAEPKLERQAEPKRTYLNGGVVVNWLPLFGLDYAAWIQFIFTFSLDYAAWIQFSFSH